MELRLLYKNIDGDNNSPSAIGCSITTFSFSAEVAIVGGTPCQILAKSCWFNLLENSIIYIANGGLTGL